MKSHIKKGLRIAILLAGSASSAAYSQEANRAPAAVETSSLGSTWSDAARMPDLFTGMWMTFTPMTEGNEALNIPFTEEAQQFVAEYQYRRDIPYAEEGCLPPGPPVSMRAGPIQFTYTPGLIAIYQQATGHTRFVRMNQPMGVTTPKYYGNSVGHWEGDTLVIETQDFLPEISFQYGVGEGLPPLETVGPISADGSGGLPGPGGPGGPGGPPPGFGGPGGPGGPPPGFGGPPPGGQGGFGGPNGVDGPPPGGLQIGPGDLSKAIWGPHGENMRMVERIRLIDENTFQMQLTIYDDTVWTQPYQAGIRNYTRIRHGISEIGPFSGQPEEWVCTVSITSFDPETNTYVDKDPEEMVRFLDELGQ